MKHKNIAYISKKALINNYINFEKTVEEKARIAGVKTPKVICVVKADAYGHGIEAVAKSLGDAGCDFFAVSSEDEACELRKIENENGRHPDILILGRIDPENIPDMLEEDITCAVVSCENAMELDTAVRKYNAEHGTDKKLKVHIKADTGMNRVGFISDENHIGETAENIRRISVDSELDVCGLFTHFSSADDELMDKKTVHGFENYGGYTALQLRRFTQLINRLREINIDPGLIHAANSAASLELPEAYFDAVRAGVIIYGLMPNGAVDERFSPVMRFESTVTHIHKVHRGDRISYGATYESDGEKLVATVAAGYADGFERAYGGCNVRINGKSYRQIGRICMDQFMIDITPEIGDSDVKIGDHVILFGGDDGASTNALAKTAGTINYEVICKVSKRVPRIMEE